MADAYSLNMTSGALEKNGVLLTNVLDVELFFHADFSPGPGEAAIVGGAPNVGFTLTARIHDTAADARILAQGPAGLLGGSVAAFAGTPSQYRLRSRTGDTLALTNVPGTVTATGLEGQSSDGFAP
jgi:hypothetical protein